MSRASKAHRLTFLIDNIVNRQNDLDVSLLWIEAFPLVGGEDDQ
jgi:hypothetical protein